MAGSTTALQSQIANGEVLAEYADGSSSRLQLINPDNWWPIDQDYFIDDYAFRRTGPLPLRVDLATGLVRQLQLHQLQAKVHMIPGGSATVIVFRYNRKSRFDR